MSGEAATQALNPIGPRQGRVRALSVGTSAANVDVTTLTELSEGVTSNQILSLTADGGDIWYLFSDSSGTAIDRTNTTASNNAQADYLPAGASRDVHIPWAPGSGGNSGTLCKFLHHQSAVPGVILRISVASEALNQRLR